MSKLKKPIKNIFFGKSNLNMGPEYMDEEPPKKIEQNPGLKQNENVVFHYINESKDEWDYVDIDLLEKKAKYNCQEFLIKSS